MSRDETAPMVSKAFFTGSKYLVEENDGRHDYVRYDGERFLAALSAAGQKVVHAPFGSEGLDSSDGRTESEEADEAKAAYLKALVRVNERYFAAREYEDDAKGKYLKHDERAERRFRIKTAEALSDCVDDLHALLSAHDTLVDIAVETVGRTKPDSERRQAESAIRSRLLACTDRAISRGWFPVVESYYYSLSPGELVAEDRERRKQRIEGTEDSRGIEELLGKPHFDRLGKGDLRRIRKLNRESPGSDARVWKRILEQYPWYVGHEDEQAATAGTGAKG
ncbi:hypothetical protein [Halorussus aquaticus]|uniref:Uncharacterized protein n=1 Tax=Halorussus aquaticus TaxID=2953748 RepID=A0ABD5PX05_9EURY|nr:hypothetical protein [Halorussus aquaticus]